VASLAKFRAISSGSNPSSAPRGDGRLRYKGSGSGTSVQRNRSRTRGTFTGTFRSRRKTDPPGGPTGDAPEGLRAGCAAGRRTVRPLASAPLPRASGPAELMSRSVPPSRRSPSPKSLPASFSGSTRPRSRSVLPPS